MSLSQTITYDTPSEFTYDTDLIEINGGNKAALKKLTYANELFFASYHQDFDGNRGVGVLTATLVGAPTILNGDLDLTGSLTEHVKYAGASNSFSSIGTITTRFTPNYTGSPASNQYIFALGESVSAQNRITVHHNINGRFYVSISDSGGSSFFAGSTPVHSATSGTSIHLALCVDVIGGDIRLFINGVELLTGSATGTRTEATNIFVGTDVGGTSTPNIKVSYLQIHSIFKYIANFTPDANEDADYSTDNPTIMVNASTLIDGISLLSEVATKVDSEVKYTINFGGVDKYWTGAAWATSDGTYSQANTAADVNTNVGTLDLSTGGTFKLKVFLHSDAGYSTPLLTSNSLDYSFFISASLPNECIIYGWVLDSKGEGVSGAEIITSISAPFFHGENLISDSNSSITNSDGYWEMSLVETETVTQKILITVNKTQYQITVPDLVSSALSAIV